ncbi:MAG: hypothetical protein LBR00_03495, partial [Clostridiales Family XIII bacterium]|nr:hypothetical protein [Clostridiales Family XIII bacterium]
REDEIAVEAMPALPLRVGAENRFGEGDLLFYRTYVRFLGETPGIHLSYPVGGYFDDMARWVDAPSEPTRFFSIDPDGESEKPAGDYLVGYARGYYGETVGLPERMARYAKDKGLTPVGPVYNIYLHDEVSVKDESRYLMQASVAVRG